MRSLARLFAVLSLIIASLFLAPVATAQEPQTTLRPFAQLHILSFRLEAVRYENTDSPSPSVIIYGVVQNNANMPYALRADTFRGTQLTSGSSVFTSAGYTFANGMRPGQEGSFSNLNLGPGVGRLIAFRYRLRGPLRPDGYMWTLRNQTESGSGTSNQAIPGPVLPKPLPASQLPTPPAVALRSEKSVAGDGSFVALGPWRIRLDEVAYGNGGPGRNTGLTTVMATLQNTFDTDRVLTRASLSSRIMQSSGESTLSGANWANNSTTWTQLVVRPGESVALQLTHYLPDAPAQHRARHWTLAIAEHAGTPRSVTLNLPQPDKGPYPDTSRPPIAQLPPPPASPPSPPPPPPSEPNPPPTTPSPPQPQPTYDAPAAPTPNPGAEQAMRALEGEWTFGTQGTITLRYEGGLLVGQLRGNGLNGHVDAVKLTIDAQGKLTGTVQRPMQPPWQMWMTAVWTASADGQRLQGQNSPVHMPNAPPANIDARRKAATPPPTTTPGPTTPQPPAPSADLSRFTGEFSTSRGDRLTFSTEGGQLIGRAVGENRQAKETLTLAPSGAGRFTGQWREMTMNGLEAGQVSLSFLESGDGFSGDVRWTAGPMGPPIQYTGSRRGPADAAPSAASTAAGAGGFQSTAYLDMKVDRVTRSAEGIRVLLTTRNAEDVRKGIGHDTQDYSIMGSNGVEYRSDGNLYSHEGPMLNTTVWMAKDAQAPVAYQFRNVPAGVTATRMILRERYGDRRTTTLTLPAA